MQVNSLKCNVPERIRRADNPKLFTRISSWRKKFEWVICLNLRVIEGEAGISNYLVGEEGTLGSKALIQQYSVLSGER